MYAKRSLGFLGVGVLTLTASFSVPSQPVTAGPAPIPRVKVFGGRTAAQPFDGKFDATLADLVAHSLMVRAGSELADLHVMNPAIRVRQIPSNAQPLILIDAVTRGDPQALKASLQSLGLIEASVYSNDVGGWLPTSSLSAAAALVELHSIRAAMPRKRSGAVTTQGDFAQGTEQLRTSNPALTGSGVTVGVLSDSFNCYAVYAEPNSGVPASGYNGYAYNGFTADYQQDISTGDLPAGVKILAEAPCLDFGAPIQLPFTDEGRAILQIVHDVAPGAGLAFHTAVNSEADFATGIGALANAGAKVEADDIGYPDEPFFQDGLVAQAVDAVQAKGVAYFSAAGNDAQNSYETASPTFSTPPVSSGVQKGESLLQFTASGQPPATSLSVQLPALFPGEFVFVELQWDQPYVTGTPSSANSPGASSQLDLCISGESGGDEVLSYTSGNATTCTGLNAIGSDPNQILLVGIPANAVGDSQPTTINISVGLGAGSTAPGRIKLVVDDDGAGSVINSTYATDSPTIQGHPAAAGAVAVGAAFYFDTPLCGTTPTTLEFYSSKGGDPILFDTSGKRLAMPTIRQKPEVIGPDGGNNTFLGEQLKNTGPAGESLTTNIAQCQNNPNYPNFLGTSAATPHVASIAALLLQTNPSLTPAQIVAALEASASPMSTTVPDPAYQDGYGFARAGAALAVVPPGPPTLTLSASSITVGGSATLSWSSINSSTCTASGSWSGPLASSGSQSLTPGAVGSQTYALTCSNAEGSASSSVMLSVVAAAAAHSGGGAMDTVTVLTLLALWLTREIRRRRRI